MRWQCNGNHMKCIINGMFWGRATRQEFPAPACFLIQGWQHSCIKRSQIRLFMHRSVTTLRPRLNSLHLARVAEDTKMWLARTSQVTPHTLDTPLSGEGALYITNPHIDQPPLQSTLLSRRQTIDDWVVKEPCIWLSAGLNPDKKVNLVGESNPCYEPPHCNALTSHLV